MAKGLKKLVAPKLKMASPENDGDENFTFGNKPVAPKGVSGPAMPRLPQLEKPGKAVGIRATGAFKSLMGSLKGRR